MLRMPVYKQVLFCSSTVKELKRKRIKIWNNILFLDKIYVDYETIRE